MMAQRETLETLVKMKGLVDEVVYDFKKQVNEPDKMKVRLADYFDEYGMHLKNERNKKVVWFGISHPRWMDTGKPFTIGIWDKAPKETVDRLNREFGEQKVIDDWYFYGLSEECISDGSRNRIVSIIKETTDSVIRNPAA